jgi:hypothetical protein
LSAEEIALERKTNDETLSLYTDRVWLHSNDVISKDLSLTMIHNHAKRKMHYVFECPADFYDETAILKMSQWFQSFLTHLFTKDTKTNEFDRTLESISNISQ